MEGQTMIKKRASYAVIASERFLALPNDTQALYLALAAKCNTEGFIDPYALFATYPFKEADLQLLIDNQFVEKVENGVKVKIDKYETGGK